MEGFCKITATGKSDLIADLRNCQICGEKQLRTLAQAVIGEVGIWRLVDKAPENGAAACFSDTSSTGDIGKADLLPVVLLYKRDHFFQCGQVVVADRRRILAYLPVLVEPAPDITDQALYLQFRCIFREDPIYFLDILQNLRFPSDA